ILAGDETTGVCLMAVEPELDTGGIYASVAMPIGPEESADELHFRLGQAGTELLVARLRSGAASLGRPVPQRGEPTYAEKVTPGELLLDFARPAPLLTRLVRAGRAWTTFRGGRLLVHRATVEDTPVEAEPGTILGGRVATGAGWLRPTEVQAAGREHQSFDEWLRGARPRDDERLGADAPALD
ncbi:MAG: methionyl-tRNA formyltransferase, partial [Acidimicrobiales bacterium]